MSSHVQMRFNKELKNLTIKDIQLLIDNNIDESQNLEYKQPTEDIQRDTNDLAEAISGFLNTEGGVIVFGVAEKKVKQHTYPSKIKYSRTPKEQLESLLISKVVPWEDKINIHRIKNNENEEEAIFVIEVPRSNNPPHMFNYRYYQRLNFQTQPMNHQSVFRTFQTNWTRKQDLIQTVIEPLYSEITEFCFKIQAYNPCGPTKHDKILLHNRFLYELMDEFIKKRINEFYELITQYNSNTLWITRIIHKAINEEFLQLSSERIKREIRLQGMDRDNITFYVQWRSIAGTMETSTEYIQSHIILYDSLEKYLKTFKKDMTFIDYEVLFKISNEKITKQTFEALWHRCYVKLNNNVIITSISDQKIRLSTLGKEILQYMQTNQI